MFGSNKNGIKGIYKVISKTINGKQNNFQEDLFRNDEENTIIKCYDYRNRILKKNLKYVRKQKIKRKCVKYHFITILSIESTL